MHLVWKVVCWLTFLKVLDLAKATKEAVLKQDFLAWQYNTIGVLMTQYLLKRGPLMLDLGF